MSTLAIQGHSTRGSEVIAFLKMLGGKNPYGCNGLGTLCAYHIIEGNIQVVTIEDLFKNNEYILYSLEGILSKFPYKVGDKVIHNNEICIITKMIWEEYTNTVAYKLNDKLYCNVIKDLQPYKEQETMKKEILPYFLTVYDSKENKHEIVATDGYEIIQENGKCYAVKKKSKYPSNCTECCAVLGIKNCGMTIDLPLNYSPKICRFVQLLIYRDAYWKIAGEQMGLGKPWEPDWTNYNEYKFVIGVNENEIIKCYDTIAQFILAFPTEEMRDAFYENFKDLIERCKKLL